jgi:jumonji domain-containing protein 2
MYFINSEESINAFLEEHTTSLIFYAKCCIQVLTSCYAVLSHEICDGWLCAQCKEMCGPVAYCLQLERWCLVLKQTKNNKWAMSCVLLQSQQSHSLESQKGHK